MGATTMRTLRAKPLLMALALAACAPAPAEQHAATVAQVPARPAPPPQAVATPAAATPAPPQEAALAPIPVPPPRERPDQSLAPERLVGLSEEDIKRLIGDPGGVREEPPAVVWSYSSARCGLNVFFYMDMATQTFRALTYELKPKALDGLAGSACLGSLRPASP
jgi:hypothetical protein